MSQNNTDIQVKRSTYSLNSLKEIELLFGEPLFIDETSVDSAGFLTDPVKAYLVMGRKLKDGETNVVDVQRSPVFKALSKDMADNLVFYDADNGTIINEAGEELSVNRLTVQTITPNDLSDTDTSKYHILVQKDDDNTIQKFALEDAGIFMSGKGIMRGAAWNDYAEFRICTEEVVPGQIVCDDGKGSVKLASEKLQACAHVVSDTYGHIIGDEEGSVPIAVAGRVLVNVNEEVKLGDCICAGPNGIGMKMSRQEIANFPDKIVGVVCEIPETEFIDSLAINGRVWINVK